MLWERMPSRCPRRYKSGTQRCAIRGVVHEHTVSRGVLSVCLPSPLPVYQRYITDRAAPLPALPAMDTHMSLAGERRSACINFIYNQLSALEDLVLRWSINGGKRLSMYDVGIDIDSWM